MLHVHVRIHYWAWIKMWIVGMEKEDNFASSEAWTLMNRVEWESIYFTSYLIRSQAKIALSDKNNINIHNGYVISHDVKTTCHFRQPNTNLHQSIYSLWCLSLLLLNYKHKQQLHTRTSKREIQPFITHIWSQFRSKSRLNFSISHHNNSGHICKAAGDI